MIKKKELTKFNDFGKIKNRLDLEMG